MNNLKITLYISLKKIIKLHKVKVRLKPKNLAGKTLFS